MTDWLDMKKAELLRLKRRKTENLETWDITRFIKIIDDQAREIRRLKVQLGGKR